MVRSPMSAREFQDLHRQAIELISLDYSGFGREQPQPRGNARIVGARMRPRAAEN